MKPTALVVPEDRVVTRHSTHLKNLARFGFLVMLAMSTPILTSGCSSKSDNSAETLERQIELQQIRHELATEQVDSERKSPAELERLGDAYLRRGDINRAYLYYLKGLNAEPGRVSLLQKQGRLLIKKKKYAEAEQIYGRLLPIAGDDPQTLVGRSMVHFGQGRFEEAEKGFLAALAKKDDDWQTHEYLGLIYSRKQEYDQAVVRFKTALALRPKDVSIINNLAVTLYLKGDFADSVRLLESQAAIAKDPRMFNNLALAHFQLGNYGAALDCFMKGSASEATAYNNLGREFLYAKQYEKAIEAFEKAIALNPRYYAAAQASLEKAKRQLAQVLVRMEE